MPTKQQDINQALEKQLKKLNKNIAEQNFYMTRSQTVIRGLINGLFTALGATVGLTIVLLLLGSVLRTVSAVPFINEILQQTGISTIIEYQLDQIENEKPTNLPNTGDDILVTPTLNPTTYEPTQ